MSELIAWVLLTACAISMILYPHIIVWVYGSISFANFNIPSFCLNFCLGFNVLDIFLISNPNISALRIMKGKSKKAELYPPTNDGLINAIILKNSIINWRSSSSFSQAITFSNPLLSFIPIMKILLSSGDRPVVSISNTNLCTSSYSSKPLKSLLFFCIRYCSAGAKIII